MVYVAAGAGLTLLVIGGLMYMKARQENAQPE